MSESLKHNIAAMKETCQLPSFEQVLVTLEEALAEIDRLEHNQMSTDYANLARITALQTQEADAAARFANATEEKRWVLEQKCQQFTKALMTAMHLIDQLVTENGRLCAASNTPPPIQLFTAKRNFEIEMKKLLGDNESAREESDN